jgi:hypothetical protein
MIEKKMELEKDGKAADPPKYGSRYLIEVSKDRDVL